MKTNLSSQITLNRVSTRYYRPENAFERSVLTRLEKIPTDIYETAEEGADQIARDIAQLIRDKQKAGRFCVLALAGGNSPRNVYANLVRMHKEEGLSFRNVIVFNLYEYYPLVPEAATSNLNALREMLLDHVDIDKQNIFSPDGTIAKDTIFEYCRLYEQRIESFGGLDIALLGIGRVIGESAALIYTMGTFINDSPTLLSQGTSLAVQIWSIMSGEQPNYELACAISIIILVFVLILNFAVKVISKRFSKAWY